MNYYDFLGIDPNSSFTEIKAAYRIKAKEFHPDRNNGNKNFEDKFKKLNEIYKVLSDPKKREAYDRKLRSSGNRYSSNKEAQRDESYGDTSEEENSSNFEQNSSETEKTECTFRTLLDRIVMDFTKLKLSIRRMSNIRIIIFLVSILIICASVIKIKNYYESEKRRADEEFRLRELEEENRESLYTTKNFQFELDQISVKKIQFDSKWRKGLMYYKVQINYSKYVPEHTWNKIEFELLDDDGFKIGSIPIWSYNTTQSVSNEGKLVGATINTNTAMDSITFMQFKKCDITYISK